MLSVGDAYFQKKCMVKMAEFRRRGKTLLLSHATAALSQLCDRACPLASGKLISDGPVDKVLKEYADVTGKTGAAHKPGAVGNANAGNQKAGSGSPSFR